jgi:cytochrome c5
MKRFFFCLSFSALAVLVSCSKDNETDVNNNPGNGGNNGCDTTSMKFSANVRPILETNCYSCHSNATFSISGVKLEDHADVKARAESGSLLGTISHAAGFPPMPQGGSKLSACNINKIRAWINQGALNN